MTKEQKIRINFLVKEFAKKNGDATVELYTTMYNVLFSFLSRFTYEDGWIVEAIDSTFDTIIEKASKILYVNCYAWILKTSRNKILNVIRRETNRKKFIDTEEAYIYEEDICEKLDILNRLDKLPMIEKQILYLLHKKKISYKDVSKILKTSESTIRRREKEIIIYLEGSNE